MADQEQPKRPYVRAGYGSQAMWRTYCTTCRTWTFVVDERKACCGGVPPVASRVTTKQMSTAQPKRKKPTVRIQRIILKEQRNRCLYCGMEFGSAITRNHHGREEVFVLTVEWDHAEPYCYGHNNSAYNFVAACQVCNRLKSGKVFDSLESAREYLDKQREAKGYDF